MHCPRLSRQAVPVFLGLLLGLLAGCTHSSRAPLSPSVGAWQAKREKDEQHKGERVVRAADPVHTESGLACSRRTMYQIGALGNQSTEKDPVQTRNS